MKKTISELFVKHSMHTNQALINDLVKLSDKQKQETLEDCRLMTASVEKNIWEGKVYLRLDKIWDGIKKLTNTKET